MTRLLPATQTLAGPLPGTLTTLRPGGTLLRVEDGRGSRDVLLRKAHLAVGADPRSDLSLRDPGVSGLHCELRLAGEGFFVRDLGSKNGTWVERARVQEAWLPVGRAVRVGTSTLTLLGLRPVPVPVCLRDHFGPLLGTGLRMGELFGQLDRLAATELDVLLIGETGTGKEQIARTLHERSPRGDGPFIVVDCTVLSPSMAGAVLFGHRRGSFTGAVEHRAGLLEQADGGTLFLDEIGDLPVQVQPMLLRALEGRQTRRIGEATFRPFEARVISATHRDIPGMIREGAFREDLYYRLACERIEVPALRERGDGNVSLLAGHFLEEVSRRRGQALRLDQEAYRRLREHHWPGNVRELRHAIRRAGMMSRGPLVGAEDLRLPEGGTGTVDMAAGQGPTGEVIDEARARGQAPQPWRETRRALGRTYAEALLARCGGNQTRAADLAGVHRNTFRRLLDGE